jgi:hypothetical protein
MPAARKDTTVGDGEPRPATMFRFMALVNGPVGDTNGRLAKGFDDAASQQTAFAELRVQLVERLLRDGLPAWALLHLERDRRVRAANRAAARLQDRHAELVRLEAGRECAARGEGDDPGLAALIDAQRAHRRAERRFARRAAKVRRGQRSR